MAMSAKLILVAVLVILGLYFVIGHTASPINHEAVGLGTNHMMHALFGVVLLAVAGFVLWRSRKKK